MDNLTHGLLGLAIGALRRPDGLRGEGREGSAASVGGGGDDAGQGGAVPSGGDAATPRRRRLRWPRTPLATTPTDRAVLLASVIAAELPDLDNFWPEPDAVLHALRAHRGLSHALVVSPLWALVATAVGCLVFRRARFGSVFLFSMLAVVFGHLAGDLWTGWGTRLLLPFSDQRLSLDWVAVIDPYLTLPLLIGAFWAWRRRDRWRQALVVGLAISSAYLGFRVASRAVLMGRVEGAYAAAREVEVFPTLLSMSGWRWVAVLPDGYVAGRVSLLGPLVEEGRHGLSQALPAAAAQNPTVEEALAWARIPVTSVEPLAGGRLEVRVADLRYHMGGEPTLEFVVVVGPEGETEDARLERGGSARDLYERWRAPGAPSAAGAR